MANTSQKHWHRIGLAAALTCLSTGSALAQDFNWKKHQGTTITFLSSNHPWANAALKHKDDFEKQTGITLKVDTYQEQQMRQRLVTVMNAKSDEVDLFMSLPSREGKQFAKAGWYADLNPLLAKSTHKEYDFKDFSAGLVNAETHDGKLSGIPLNIEGPVIYWRKDLFAKCGVTAPRSLDDLLPLAQKLKACDANVVPITTRGLKGAVPYTFSAFLHNAGGNYLNKDRKSNLCSKEGQAALALYSTLLKDFGPPGATNVNFYQNSSLYREGKAAMSFESSNELRSVMDGGARAKDTGVMLLPRGARSQPTVIGWGLSISAHSKKQEAAWLFVQWATSRTMQEKLALDGIAPPRTSVANDPDFKAWIAAEPVRAEWIAAINEANRSGTSEVGYPIVANVASREFIGAAVNEIVLGQKTVAQACADADKGLNELIAKE
jgi:multiple sugar transport system substrate-binding protein